MLNYFALIMQKTIQSNLDAYYDQNGIRLKMKLKKSLRKQKEKRKMVETRSWLVFAEENKSVDFFYTIL